MKTARSCAKVKPRVIPPRPEWDFRSSFLPEDEVLSCFNYEEARTGKRWIQDVLAWRKTVRGKDFVELLKCFRVGGGLNFGCPATQFYACWPEWPLTPYLGVNVKVRKERIEAWTGRNSTAGPPLESVSFQYIFAHWDAIHRVPRPVWLRGEFTHAIMDPSGLIRFERNSLSARQEIVSFRIRYNLPNKVLARQFIEWLETRRKENSISNPNQVGENSLIQKKRKELLALGAWRLTELSGNTYEAASNYSQEQSGKPLFSDNSTWSKSVRLAKKLFGADT